MSASYSYLDGPNGRDAEITRIVERALAEENLALAASSYSRAGSYEAFAVMAEGRGDLAHAEHDRAFAAECRERGLELTRRALGAYIAEVA